MRTTVGDYVLDDDPARIDTGAAMSFLKRSRDAMQRLGARFEGILRAHRLGTDLRPRDSARFSVTAADWPAVRQHLEHLATRYE